MLWSLNARINASTAWHAHDIFEWILCRSGSGRLELESRKISLQSGRSLLIAPGVRHRYELHPDEEASFKVLCLNSRDIAARLAPAQLAFLDALRVTGLSYADHGEATARTWILADLIPDGFNGSEPRDLEVIWGSIGLLLALHAKACDLPANQDGGKYRQKIQDIRTWIDSRLHEDFSLDEVGNQFGLSRSVLTREFRRYIGKSFIDYCNGRRIEMAATILAAGKESVTQAALQSGFANLSHFHRQFKAMYGLTPGAFRRQILGETGQ